eukprot:228081-Amorphochlora_amoeboformis.AAC.3
MADEELSTARQSTVNNILEKFQTKPMVRILENSEVLLQMKVTQKEVKMTGFKGVTVTFRLEGPHLRSYAQGKCEGIVKELTLVEPDEEKYKKMKKYML